MKRMKHMAPLALVALLLFVTACRIPETQSRPSQPKPLSTSPQLEALAQQQGGDPFADAQGAIDAARQLGLPPGNYRVDVERIWVSQSDVSAIGSMFKYKSGNAVLKGGAPLPAPGFTIGVVGKSGYAGLTVAKQSLKNADRSEMFLVTMAGTPASLRVGKTRYVTPLTIFGLGMKKAIVLPAEQFIGADFQVTVRPAGAGLVTVSLTPSFTGIEPGGRGVLNVTELTSTVTVPLGDKILLSSSDNTTDTVAKTMFSRVGRQGNEQGVIILSVSGG